MTSNEPAGPDYALLDRAGAASVAFYPRPDQAAPPSGAMDNVVEIEPGVGLGVRFYAFDKDAPTILYFHGNGEVASDHDDVARSYQEAGANLLVVEFRGYGRSNGSPTFANLVSDARGVATWFQQELDELGFSPQRFVMGRSMGAHSALEIAANAPDGFLGLIIESGAGNLRRFVARLGADEAEGQRLLDAHEAKIRSIRLPVLMLHGEWDELIPLDSAIEVYDLLAGTDRDLVVIPGAGHNDILWVGHRQYFTAIAAFLASTVLDDSEDVKESS